MSRAKAFGLLKPSQWYNLHMSITRAPLSEVFKSTDALQLIDSQVYSSDQLTEVIRQTEALLKFHPELDNHYCNFRARPSFQNLELLAKCLGRIYIFTPFNTVGTTKMLIDTQANPNGSVLRDCKYPALILQILLSSTLKTRPKIITKCLPNKLLHPNLIVELSDGSKFVVDFMFEGIVSVSQTKYSAKLEPRMLLGECAFLETSNDGWDLLDELVILDHSFRRRKELNLSSAQLRSLAGTVLARHPDLEGNAHITAIQNLVNHPEIIDTDNSTEA